jgi:hypothetical protein
MAIVQGRKSLVVCTVFIENLVGLLVFSTFIRQTELGDGPGVLCWRRHWIGDTIY